MISIARTLRIDASQPDAWANLNDLASFARVMPILSEVTVESERLHSRFVTRVGIWSIAGSLRMHVTERSAPNRLRVQGTVALDEGWGSDPVRFDVAWYVEPDGDHTTRVNYIMRVRATATLERLASMAMSRRARSLDRRVAAALSAGVAGRVAA